MIPPCRQSGNWLREVEQFSQGPIWKDCWPHRLPEQVVAREMLLAAGLTQGSVGRPGPRG